MEPKLADLVDALPSGPAGARADALSVSLPGLLQDLGQRPVPVGRFHRAQIFGSLQAKIAVAYLAYWIRTCYRGVDVKQQRLNDVRLKAALEALGSMAYLRGAAMKIGQFVANYPHVAPEEFAQVLSHLHFEAPRMHFSLLREFFRNELNADPEEVFEEFETKAFAAASLGQVHRARLKGSGEQVAVKVQYPSIGRTIRDDFRNLKALFFPMRLSSDWDSLKRQFEELRAMLERETDYEQEAENLRDARGAFEDEDGIVIPKVYPELSTKRVLTMEFIDGVHLEEFLRGDPPQELRDQFGAKLAVASARLQYDRSMVYADPQAGNYYFMPDGRLGVVDFGCCRYLGEEDKEYSGQMEVALQTSAEALQQVLMRAMDLGPRQPANREHLHLLEQVATWLWEPIAHEGPFDFGDSDYFRRGLELRIEVMRGRHVRALPVIHWLDRNYLGLRALMYRLRARVDLGALVKKETNVTVPPKVEGNHGKQANAL